MGQKSVRAASVSTNKGPFVTLVKIVNIEGNSFTVERIGATFDNASSNFIVNTNKDTEFAIFKNDLSFDRPSPDDYSQLTISDLKIGMQTLIFTGRELDLNNENNALQIIVRLEKDYVETPSSNW